MVGQVCPAVDAAVGAVAGGQVSLEGLRLGHLYHVSGAGLLTGVRAGTGRVAALLDLLTEETLEDASKSRRCCGVGVWHVPHRHHGRKSNLQGGRQRDRDVVMRGTFHFALFCSTRDPDCISNNKKNPHLQKQSFDYNHLLCDYNRMCSTWPCGDVTYCNTTDYIHFMTGGAAGHLVCSRIKLKLPDRSRPHISECNKKPLLSGPNVNSATCGHLVNCTQHPLLALEDNQGCNNKQLF